MSHTRTPEEHLAEVSRTLREVCPRPVVNLPALNAMGRTLATAVAAPQDSPAFDNSQMDGYALSAEQLSGGVFPVGPTIAAGADPSRLYPDAISTHLAPIMTGARIPAGTAAIVPVERCDPPEFVTDGNVRVPATDRGQFIRRVGSDLAKGAELFPAGHRVNARTVGAAALLGVQDLPVLRPARVVICTGGEEIGGTGAAQIPDANGPMLAALCDRHHIEVAAHISTSDSPEALEAALTSAISEYRPDAIISSGGISHGKFEVVRQVLEPHGGWFGHVSQQPGGPQGLATFRDTPVICLPGNPVSTAVSFRLFVAPTLGEAQPPFTTIAGEDVQGIAGRECFVRGGVENEEGSLRSRPIGGRGSHLLAQSAAATVLLRIPADTLVREGESVETYWL